MEDLSASLLEADVPWVASCWHDDGGTLRWAYHDHSVVGLIEPVDAARRPRIEARIPGDGDGS